MEYHGNKISCEIKKGGSMKGTLKRLMLRVILRDYGLFSSVFLGLIWDIYIAHKKLTLEYWLKPNKKMYDLDCYCWNHIVIVYNGFFGTLYVNGEQHL